MIRAGQVNHLQPITNIMAEKAPRGVPKSQIF